MSNKLESIVFVPATESETRSGDASPIDEIQPACAPGEESVIVCAMRCASAAGKALCGALSLFYAVRVERGRDHFGESGCANVRMPLPSCLRPRWLPIPPS